MNPIALGWPGDSTLAVELFDYSLIDYMYMEDKDLPTEYIKGNDTEFVIFVQSLKDMAELKGIEGKMRWVITREDGSKYIARPESAKDIGVLTKLK